MDWQPTREDLVGPGDEPELRRRADAHVHHRRADSHRHSMAIARLVGLDCVDGDGFRPDEASAQLEVTVEIAGREDNSRASKLRRGTLRGRNDADNRAPLVAEQLLRGDSRSDLDPALLGRATEHFDVCTRIWQRVVHSGRTRPRPWVRAVELHAEAMQPLDGGGRLVDEEATQRNILLAGPTARRPPRRRRSVDRGLSSIPTARCIDVPAAAIDPTASAVVPPTRVAFSINPTRAPASAAATAAARPLPPPPTTRTSSRPVNKVCDLPFCCISICARHGGAPRRTARL